MSPNAPETSYQESPSLIFIDGILRFWLWTSILLLTVTAGWILAKKPWSWGAIIGSFLVLLWPLLLQIRRRKYTQNRTLVCSLHWVISIGLFILGWYVAHTNALQANAYIDNSVRQISAMLIEPVHFYAEREGAMPLNQEVQQRLRNRSIKFLNLRNNDIDRSMLISLRAGLAIVRGQQIQFVRATGAILSLSSLLPDQSFLFYSPMDFHRDTWDGVGVETLTRAVIRNGTLYKLWEREMHGMYLHHWGDSLADEIYYPGKNFVDLPDGISKRMNSPYGNCAEDDAIRDNISILDTDTGRRKTVIDIMPILVRFAESHPFIAQRMTKCLDPLHLNDVQILKNEQQAGSFPDGKIGDMLISLRNIHSLLLLDKDTLAVKWHVSNGFTRQHSPYVTDRGTILVFDNKGSAPVNGLSRIVEIDIATKEVIGFWEATGKDFFESKVRGRVTMLGEKIIVQEQDEENDGDAMFALDCPNNRLSMACSKKLILYGKLPDFVYNNAVFFPK